MGELFDLAPRVPPEWERVESHYREYADRVHGYLRRHAAGRGLTESLVDTEGAVHEAFLSMASSTKTINDPSAWLCTVARNLVCKDAERHQNRRVDGDPHDLLDNLLFQWSSLAPQTSAERRFETRQLLEAIGELPNRQAQAIYLHHVQGRTYRETADILGIDESTVGVHIHRGIKRLRDWARRAAVSEKLQVIIGIVGTGMTAIVALPLSGLHGAVAACVSVLFGRQAEDDQRSGQRGTGEGHPALLQHDENGAA